MAKISKKHLVLQDLYEFCVAKNDFVFHNDLVKDIAKKHDFGNPFDMTKLDCNDDLPQFFLRNIFWWANNAIQ